ncbi:tail fiber protein [Pseudoalteromonas sp. DL2-H2.2]|uniref:phage tail protein n=1 Tax=Pseudoalteromonas sp. DL2-H2.2 TaxID=2908889 RepID=UPI001F2CD52F|nr:tail fiber protein [Pseudoalteromonas sp. DL2-H2.2]MCF2907383.1 tail fiber protein [Pseudoalteromonas sp. DL2-H2.2]
MLVEAYQGDMMPYGGDFTVEGYAPCDGSLMSVNQNQALFTILGTKYGGDGRSTFATPDLRGRSPIRYGKGPGLSDYPLGWRSGTEKVKLAPYHLPPHSHKVEAIAQFTMVSNNANTTYPDYTGNSYMAPIKPPKPTLHTSSSSFFTPSDFEEADFLSPIKGVEIEALALSKDFDNVEFDIRNPVLAIGWQICILGAYPRRA